MRYLVGGGSLNWARMYLPVQIKIRLLYVKIKIKREQEWRLQTNHYNEWLSICCGVPLKDQNLERLIALPAAGYSVPNLFGPTVTISPTYLRRSFL